MKTALNIKQIFHIQKLKKKDRELLNIKKKSQPKKKYVRIRKQKKM